MVTVLWVAFGGAAGSVARYALGGLLNNRAHPLGTIVVNVIGSLVLGVLIGLWGFEEDAAHRLGISIGLLGGFTTFSTFALDTLSLWENGQPGVAIANVAASVGLGIAAAIAGLMMGRSAA